MVHGGAFVSSVEILLCKASNASFAHSVSWLVEPREIATLACFSSVAAALQPLVLRKA